MLQDVTTLICNCIQLILVIHFPFPPVSYACCQHSFESMADFFHKSINFPQFCLFSSLKNVLTCNKGIFNLIRISRNPFNSSSDRSLIRSSPCQSILTQFCYSKFPPHSYLSLLQILPHWVLVFSSHRN